MSASLRIPSEVTGTIGTDSRYSPPLPVVNTPAMAAALDRLAGQPVSIVDLPKRYAKADPGLVLARFYPGVDFTTLRQHPLLEAARLRIAQGNGQLVLPATLDRFDATGSSPVAEERNTAPTLPARPAKTPGPLIAFARVQTHAVVLPQARERERAAASRINDARRAAAIGSVGPRRVEDVATQEAGKLRQLAHAEPLFASYATVREQLLDARNATLRDKDVVKYNDYCAQIERLDRAAVAARDEGYNPEEPRFTERQRDLRVELFQAQVRLLGVSRQDARAAVLAPRELPPVAPGDPLGNLEFFGLE